MRSKIRKLRGRKTGYGAKKKHRGAGSQGGRGRSNLNKHKRSLITRLGMSTPYGKVQMKSIQNKLNVINLTEIDHLAAKKGLKEIDLENYKVLGTGKLTQKITIKAETFSRSAIEKIQEAGGKVEASIPIEPEKVAEKAPQGEQTEKSEKE